jgi:predicted nucleic acid-binding protein
VPLTKPCGFATVHMYRSLLRGTALDITVDTSILLAVVLNEPTKPALLRVTEGADLRSAGSLPWEVANALTALFKRGRLGLAQAQAALESFEAVPIHLADVDLAEAVKLGHDQRIYAYDACIIECARRYATPLLSLDRAQCEVARKLGIEVLEVES